MYLIIHRPSGRVIAQATTEHQAEALLFRANLRDSGHVVRYVAQRCKLAA
jgi:hypothetical protein